MFYADIGKKRFSAHENSAAFRPSFRHSETAEFEICFQNPDGSPFDLSGCTLQIALDDDFDHRFPMISHPADNSVHIVDAAAGIACFSVSCSSRKFERVVRHGPAVCSLEIIRTVNCSAEWAVILQEENIALLPRLYTDENAPAAPVKDYYYTKPQVDAMIRENLTVRLGACGGLGIQYGETGCILSWTDPDDVVVNGAELARWKQTVLIRKLNKYPASVFDGDSVARTVRENGTKNAFRSGFPDPAPEAGSVCCYKLFSQTENGVWNDLAANCFPSATAYSWNLVQSMVRAGAAPRIWPVGTVFEVSHGEYSHSDGSGLFFRVAGYDQVPAADEALTHTMCLELTDCLISAPMDCAENEYALTADAAARAGKTYYEFTGSAYRVLSAGTDYEIGDAVPAAKWFEKNIVNRESMGSSRFSQSNLLQWLNSDGAAFGWFAKQNIWDKCPNAYLARNGFCRHLDAEFLSVVQPARITTALVPQDGGGYERTNAKFWLLSASQIDGSPANGVAENVQLSFYADGGSPVKMMLNGSGTELQWLRTAYEQDVFRNRVIPLSRYTYSGNPAPGISPACIIA